MHDYLITRDAGFNVARRSCTVKELDKGKLEQRLRMYAHPNCSDRRIKSLLIVSRNYMGQLRMQVVHTHWVLKIL